MPLNDPLPAPGTAPMAELFFDIAAIRARMHLVKQFIHEAMVPDVDYGTIPGTPKPTIYKPGAEQLNDLYHHVADFKPERVIGDQIQAARAAWIGLFATALNLLPIGQLDGGHILYAITGPLHRRLSQLFAVALIPLGLVYWTGWILWAIFFLLSGLRRPPIIDEFPVGSGRLRLSLLAASIFLLSFTPNPIQTNVAL
jgi:hypothetical protein